MFVTRVTALIIFVIVFSAFSISVELIFIFFIEFLIRFLILRVVWALRWVRLRIFFAIIVKSRFCLFVRVVLIVAFKVRILVWKVMSLITLIISAIFCELVEISRIVCITLFIILSSRCVVLEVFNVRWLVWRVFSAFCFIVAVSCFMLVVVFFSEAVCCSVREERSLLSVAISLVSL